jgi:hypothetical protein
MYMQNTMLILEGKALDVYSNIIYRRINDVDTPVGLFSLILPSHRKIEGKHYKICGASNQKIEV